MAQDHASLKAPIRPGGQVRLGVNNIDFNNKQAPKSTAEAALELHKLERDCIQRIFSWFTHD